MTASAGTRSTQRIEGSVPNNRHFCPAKESMMRFAFAIPALVFGLALTPAIAADIAYEAAGQKLTGYFAEAKDPKGLVLIFHDWDGVSGHERNRADQLAAMGYDSFALDLFGADTPVETVEERIAAVEKLYKDHELMLGLVSAGMAQANALSDADQMVVIGYCFGGGVALTMARSKHADQALGYAIFHGDLAAAEEEGWASIPPPLLIMHGGADKAVPIQDGAALMAELEALDAVYTFEVYSGAPHGFTVSGSKAYQPRANRESWQALTDFLAERMGN